MGPLTALVLATPIFSMALTPPKLEALPRSIAPAAEFEATSLQAIELAAGTAADHDEWTGIYGMPRVRKYHALQLRRRARFAKAHRALGITTWALTGLAVAAGTIQWRNLYAGSIADNPCVRGDAWLGQGQCSGTPWLHALTAFPAGAVYVTTLGVASAMPAPDNAAKGDSRYARTLRTHKALRWVHLTGMIAQTALGIVIANPAVNGGLDRTNDYDTLRVLSLTHLVVGYATFAALTWAGAIMLN